jgi:rhodanese-related sulfurtransferase
MSSIDETLEKARARAKQLGVQYEGALTPEEAYRVLRELPSAKLVDVRTRAELDWVGRVPGAVEVELLSYPGNRANADFVQQLEQHVEKDAPVMFLCRSGGRSHNAAMMAMQAGYSEAYNVLEGFEGDKDDDGHRNNTGGWRAAGLPWTQS